MSDPDYQTPPPLTGTMMRKDDLLPNSEPTKTVSGNAELFTHGRYREIHVDGIALMSNHDDATSWYAAHDELLRVASGRLLIAGMGISYEAHRVAAQVSEMVLVESNPGVIALCSQFAPANATIVEAGIDEYLGDAALRAASPGFDTVYFDHTEAGFSDLDQSILRMQLVGWLLPDAQVVFWQSVRS